MSRWIAVAGLFVLTIACSLTAQDKPAVVSQPKKPASLMHKKLEYSQRILEGLATQDFPSIAKNAKAMNELSDMETWLKVTTPRYKTQLQVFRFANEELVRTAEEKNLDGASLAYMQATLSCVNCHKYVRNQPK